MTGSVMDGEDVVQDALFHLAPGIGHWHPHMMVFSPYYENSMLGGNDFGPPLPIVTDDGGTPFAVVVIPWGNSVCGSRNTSGRQTSHQSPSEVEEHPQSGDADSAAIIPWL